MQTGDNIFKTALLHFHFKDGAKEEFWLPEITNSWL